MDPQPAHSADTALGMISIAMSPAKLAGLILAAAQSLLEATVATGTCEEMSASIWHTALHRVPIACELLHLGRLFPGILGAWQMTETLLHGFKTICDALHEADMEANTFLRRSAARRWVLRRLGRLKQCFRQTQIIVHRALRDMTTGNHMVLAAMLREMQSAQQAQHTAKLMHELQEKVRAVQAQARGAQTADKKRQRAQARAARARQTPGGQVVRVSCDGVLSVTVLGLGATFATFVPVRSIGSFEQDTRTVGAEVWDVSTGVRLQPVGWCVYPGCCYGAGMEPVAWSPDGCMVIMQRSSASCKCERRSVEVWDAVAGVRWIDLVGHSANVTSAAWSPDGSRVATGSADCTAAVWDARTGTRVHELCGHSKAVNSVAWSPDGSRVATGAADCTAVVWNAATGARMCQLRGHGSAVLSVVWSPDGRRIATRSEHSTIALWKCDVATGAFVREHVLKSMQSAAWSPDGSNIVTVSTGGTAAVRDGEAWVRMHELRMRGHSGAVTKAAWSPDGSRVATVVEDKTVVVWDARSGAHMHVLSGHKKVVTSVAWSPNGATVYTSSLDGTVRIYALAGRARPK